MIKIEITDLNSESPHSILQLAEYLRKTAEHRELVIPCGSEMKRIPLNVSGKAIVTEHNFNESETQEMDVVLSPPPIVTESMIPVPPDFNPFSKTNKPTTPPQIEIDVNGLPWDSRIHARTKSKNKDGSWKNLRGVGQGVTARVTTELKTVQNIPAPPPVSPVDQTPQLGFAEFMELVTTAIKDGKLDRISLNSILNAKGIPSIPVVSTRPDLIPSIMIDIQKVIGL